MLSLVDRDQYYQVYLLHLPHHVPCLTLTLGLPCTRRRHGPRAHVRVRDDHDDGVAALQVAEGAGDGAWLYGVFPTRSLENNSVIPLADRFAGHRRRKLSPGVHHVHQCVPRFLSHPITTNGSSRRLQN